MRIEFLVVFGIIATIVIGLQIGNHAAYAAKATVKWTTAKFFATTFVPSTKPRHYQ